MNDRKIISDSELEKIMLASARALPDAPSDRGMRPAQIKKALSEPVRMLVQMLNTKLNGLAVDGDGVGDIGSSAYKETSIENLYSCTSWYDELERNESNFVVDRINPSESVTIDCMHPFTLKPSLLSLPEWSIELSAYTETVGNVLNFYTADNYLRVKCISGKYEFSYLINGVENSIVKDAEGESVITLVKSEDVISVYFNGEAVIKIKLPSNNYSFTIHQIGNDVGYIFNYLKTFGRAISEGEIEKNVIAAEYRRKKITNGEKTKLDLIFKYALEHFKIEQLINELKAADVKINSKLEELEGADSKSKDSINDMGAELDDLKKKAVGGVEVGLSNDKDYILTINVKDVNGRVTETHTVNLPLEKIVIDGEYVTDVEHGKCIQLTLDSGSVIHIPVGDLVSGLASQSSVDALSASVNVLKENMDAFEDTLEEMDIRLSDVENAQKNLNIDIDNKIASKAEQTQVDALQQEQSLIAPLARGAARSLSISKKKYTSGVDTFEYEFTLKDYLGNPIGDPVQIDLPLEEMIVDATYDDTEKVILLHLKNENIVSVPLADLITGIENKIAENYATKAALNEVSTLSSGDVSNSGWYRIAEYDGKGIASVAQGSYGNSCDLIIKKVYNTGDAEVHHLQLVSRYGNSYFQSLYSYCGYQQISKMRHVVDTVNHKAYIDLYYNPSSRNSISVQIINGKGFGDFMWKAIAPATVYETSTNENVQTEYAVSSNVSIIHSGNIDSQHVAIADELECHYDTTIAIDNPDGRLRYSSNVPSLATGIFPCVNNANAILTISKHGGNFDSQLGFSSNGNMYYRSFNDEAMNNTKPWKTVVDSDNVGDWSASANTWNCPTQLQTWSRICTIEGYSNYLINVKIDQSGEATSYVFAVGTGYDTANISQISSSGYPTPTHDTRVRVQRSSSSPMIFHFEMLNYYSASGSTVNVVCKAIKLSDSGILTPITTVTTNNVASNKEELYAHHNGVIVNSGNFEDYVRNYMNKTILEQPY